jgi:hypothetical protein
MSTWDPTRGGPDSNRRRSQRVIVNVPIIVSSEGGNRDAAFQEETQTLVVNAHGAMIALAAKVVKGQTVRIKNRATQEDHACKVVYLGPVSSGKAQVGVDFTSSAPDFWRIAFPPEDWVLPDPLPVPAAGKKR